MVIANLSNLCWTTGQPKRNQALFSQLLQDAGPFLEEGFFLQPPMVKTAKALQFSRAPEFEVVSQSAAFAHPFTVLQPVLRLPAGYPAQATRRAVAEVGQRLVKQYFRHRPYLLWINSMTHFQAQLAEQLMPDAEYSVFDSSDHLMMYTRNGGEHVAQANAILNGCDVAVCASEPAMEQISHPVKYLLSGGMETKLLKPTDAPLDLPPLFPKAAGSVYIGFMGMLSAERTDFDLLHAAFLRFPHYQFVFVGSANRASLLSRLKSYPNLHHLSDVPEELIASLIGQFDVAIVPELDNYYTRGSDSGRIFDYLACGIPVLSSNARDRDKFGDTIQVAPSVWEFSYQLERLIATPKPNHTAPQAQERWTFGTRLLKELLAKSSTYSRSRAQIGAQ
jgi:glycosyltransferase involved in cell wall biosynthesis